jgi:hypothetical protein
LSTSISSRAVGRPQQKICEGQDYELLTLIALPTDVNTWFALPPSVVIAVIQTTMIKASITAYSTAVGPSSLLRKQLSHPLKLRIEISPSVPPEQDVGGFAANRDQQL